MITRTDREGRNGIEKDSPMTFPAGAGLVIGLGNPGSILRR